jgi:octopine/nopaline transport system permease protein
MNAEALYEAVLTLPSGLILTLGLTLTSLVIGFLISVPLGLMRASRSLWLSGPILAYTYVFRGTPLLVQLFLIYYGFGQVGFIHDTALWLVFREPLWCALIAFTINSTAHSTEIFSGGFRAVPNGQAEAAKSLGLSRLQTVRLITLPLMLRIVFPAYTNEMIAMLKASSLASTVTLLEVTGLARKLVSATFAPYEVFVVAGLLYLATTLCLTSLSRRVEAYLNRTAKSCGASRLRRGVSPIPFVTRSTNA